MRRCAQRQEAAAREAEASGAKVMRLEVELAEARKALQASAELEKEVAHYRRAQSRTYGAIWSGVLRVPGSRRAHVPRLAAGVRVCWQRRC